MSGRLQLDRDGTRLAVRDFGGDGRPVLLLHGLAGYAEEWSGTAHALAPRHRVLALDARGQGRSERRPADVSRAANVADVAFAVEALELGPVALVGQSLGGHTALLVAAQHPALVSALVAAETSPDAPPDPARFAADVADHLRSWPAPFASRAAAVAYFIERDWTPTAAEAWAEGLERCADGWRPRFDADVMERTLHDAVARDCWDAWERIACQTLVVRGEHGALSSEDARAMVERLPGAQLAELAGAGHDVHLDQADAWATALTEFLEQSA